MSLNVGSIVYSVKINTQKAQGNLNELEREINEVDRELAESSKKQKNYTKSINKMGIAASGFATGGGLALFNNVRNQADVLAKTADATNLNTSSYYGMTKAASLYGVTGKQVAIITTRLALATFKASQGNDRYASTFEALGVSIYDNNGALKSNETILFETLTALSQVENQQTRTGLAYSLFGRQALAVNQIISGGAGEFEKQAKRFAETTTVTNESTSAIESMNDSIAMAQATFVEALIQMVSAISPFLDQAALFISAHENIAKAVILVGALIIGVGISYLVFAGVMMVVNTAIKIYTGLTKLWALGTKAVAMAQLLLDASLLPFILIGAAIIGVVIAIILIFKNWEAIIQFFVDAWNWFLDLIKSGLDWLQSAWQSFADFMAKIWDGFINGLKAIGDWIWKWFVQPIIDALNIVKDAFSDLLDFITGIWDSIINVFKNGINSIINLMNKIPFVNIPTFDTSKSGKSAATFSTTTQAVGKSAGTSSFQTGNSFAENGKVGNSISNVFNLNFEFTGAMSERESKMAATQIATNLRGLM